MAIEMGAKTGIMAVDDKTVEYLARRTKVPWQNFDPDPDAEYERTIDIDVGSLGPMVAKPHSPANVVPVGDLHGIRVTQVNIGTCTNGRIVDFQQALEVLRGHKVAPGVRLLVTPATEIVTRQAEELGFARRVPRRGRRHQPAGLRTVRRLAPGRARSGRRLCRHP